MVFTELVMSSYISKDMMEEPLIDVPVIEACFSDEDGKTLGTAVIHVLNAQKYHYVDIREYCDNQRLHMYETSSSVKIYRDTVEEECSVVYGHGSEEDTFDDKILRMGREMGISDRALYEGRVYKEPTLNVYGVLALMDTIKMEKGCEEFEGEMLGEMEQYLRAWGVNFLLFKPFPNDISHLISGQEINEKMLKKEVEEMVNFYEKRGYKRTVGKTDGIHVVLSLNE